MGKRIVKAIIASIKFVGSLILAFLLFLPFFFFFDWYLAKNNSINISAKELYNVKLQMYWITAIIYGLIVLLVTLIAQQIKKIRFLSLPFILFFMLIMLGVVSFSIGPFTTPYQIAGNSMLPTYHDKQYIVIQVARQAKDIHRGDVVVAEENNNTKAVVKRIIAIGEDRIMISNGSVILNGKMLNESKYIEKSVLTYGGSFLKEDVTYEVPSGSFFLMGDNRMHSEDSRARGVFTFNQLDGLLTVAGL